jgi:hypothetical protein
MLARSQGFFPRCTSRGELPKVAPSVGRPRPLRCLHGQSHSASRVRHVEVAQLDVQTESHRAQQNGYQTPSPVDSRATDSNSNVVVTSLRISALGGMGLQGKGDV